MNATNKMTHTRIERLTLPVWHFASNPMELQTACEEAFEQGRKDACRFYRDALDLLDQYGPTLYIENLIVPLCAIRLIPESLYVYWHKEIIIEEDPRTRCYLNGWYEQVMYGRVGPRDLMEDPTQYRDYIEPEWPDEPTDDIEDLAPSERIEGDWTRVAMNRLNDRAWKQHEAMAKPIEIDRWSIAW